MKYLYFIATLSIGSAMNELNAQISNELLDSLYIDQVENAKGPDKVLHAEPLYIDLIRDLGARKGEREWNIGFGITDQLNHDHHEALVEYEWAPIDRLGLEVELPFSFYTPLPGGEPDSMPSHQLNALKLATQWSFFVSEKWSTSMALGYIHEFELFDFKNFQSPFVRGNVYNPFFVVAKRWGNNFHSLIYTGPMIEHHFETGHLTTKYDINTSFHYMISGTRNFLGLEVNKTILKDQFQLVMRPQMRIDITERLLIGIVAGIPLNRQNERFSSFVRLIYEP